MLCCQLGHSLPDWAATICWWYPASRWSGTLQGFKLGSHRSRVSPGRWRSQQKDQETTAFTQVTFADLEKRKGKIAVENTQLYLNQALRKESRSLTSLDCVFAARLVVRNGGYQESEQSYSAVIVVEESGFELHGEQTTDPMGGFFQYLLMPVRINGGPVRVLETWHRSRHRGADLKWRCVKQWGLCP